MENNRSLNGSVISQAVELAARIFNYPQAMMINLMITLIAASRIVAILVEMRLSLANFVRSFFVQIQMINWMVMVEDL
jgi:hypothetical protein